MKSFNNLQSLWSYALYCPMCQNTIRDIDVMIGPEHLLSLKSWHKIDHNLIIKVKNKTDNLSVYTAEINTLTNVVNFNINIDQNLLSNLYLYIYSNCTVCDCYINSSDIELGDNLDKLKNIGVEQEGINLIKSKNKYHLILNHEHDFMLANKIFKNKYGDWENSETSCKLPMVHLDFKHPRKVIKKIESLMLFS